MTTSTTASAINPSDQCRNYSSRSSGHASAAASARGTGPVDLDETQLSIDSTAFDTNNTNNLDTNNLDAAASSSDRVEMSSHSHKQSTQYQKVGHPKRISGASATGPRGSSASTSAGGLPPRGGGPAAGSSDDVNFFMQNLLEDMTKHFDQMGETILGRIGDMGSRIDEMEKNIGNLMNQAGLEPSVGAMPVASSLPQQQDTIGEQDAEETASV